MRLEGIYERHLPLPTRWSSGWLWRGVLKVLPPLVHQRMFRTSRWPILLAFRRVVDGQIDRALFWICSIWGETRLRQTGITNGVIVWAFEQIPAFLRAWISSLACISNEKRERTCGIRLDRCATKNFSFAARSSCYSRWWLCGIHHADITCTVLGQAESIQTQGSLRKAGKRLGVPSQVKWTWWFPRGIAYKLPFLLAKNIPWEHVKKISANGIRFCVSQSPNINRLTLFNKEISP